MARGIAANLPKSFQRVFMKIDGSSPHAATPLRRKDKAQSSGGSFGESLSAGGAPASAPEGGRASGVADTGALLSLQEIPAGSLRDGLVMGRMAPDTVRRLADEVDQARAEVDDPGLNEILDEIELRAHVELAKLRR
jgi:hypothetical protein